MKKRLFVVVGAVVALAMLTVILAGCETDSSTGFFVNHSSDMEDTSWTIAAGSANGHESRTISMSADDLSALAVTSTNSSGTLSLEIMQGKITKTIDLSGQYSEQIDTSSFSAGMIALRMNYNNAKDINTSITW